MPLHGKAISHSAVRYFQKADKARACCLILSRRERSWERERLDGI
jgi:hypothetical protein